MNQRSWCSSYKHKTGKLVFKYDLQNICSSRESESFFIYNCRDGAFLGNAQEGSGSIWMDDLGCTGSESYLGNCPHAGYGTHNCQHYEDVAITCTH